jgi:hypothetical protein
MIDFTKPLDSSVVEVLVESLFDTSKRIIQEGQTHVPLAIVFPVAGPAQMVLLATDNRDAWMKVLQQAKRERIACAVLINEAYTKTCDRLPSTNELDSLADDDDAQEALTFNLLTHEGAQYICVCPIHRARRDMPSCEDTVELGPVTQVGDRAGMTWRGRMIDRTPTKH